MKQTHFRRLAAATALCSLLFQSSAVQAASSWSPTLLVNTESFQTIDVGDGTTDIELRFGSTGNNRFFYDVGNSRFHLTDDALVGGLLTVTGSAVIGGTGAPSEKLEVIGTASGRTLHAQDQLQSSGSLAIEGAAAFGSTVRINGVTYTFPFGDGSATGKVLKTDGAGNLSWSSDIDTTGSTLPAQGLTAPAAGFLGLAAVHSGTTIEGTTLLSGAIVHAQNDLQSSGTTVLEGEVTFGSGLVIRGVTYRFPVGDGSASGKVLKTDGNGNLSWSADIDTDTDTNTTYSAARGLTLTSGFFSLNAAITGTSLEIFGTASGRIVYAKDTLASSGTLVVEGAATFAGTQNCTLLTTDTNGVLTCDAEGFDESVDDRVGTLFKAGTGITLNYSDANNTLTIETAGGSGNVVNLVPEFDGAVYYGSGAATVGQLAHGFDVTNLHNYYRWTTTNAAIQDYWIAVRAILPKNFSHWRNNPIAVNVRSDTTNTGNNHMTIRLLDSAGANVALTSSGTLASTVNDTWRKVILSGPNSSGTFTAGSGITLLMKMAALSNAGAGYMDLGEVELNWAMNHP